MVFPWYRFRTIYHSLGLHAVASHHWNPRARIQYRPSQRRWPCCFVTALLPASRTAMTRPLHNTAKGTDSDNIKKRKRNSIPRRSKLPFRFRPSSRSLNSETLVVRIHRDSATSSLMQSLGFSFSSLHLSLLHTMMHQVTVSASTTSTPQAHFRTLTFDLTSALPPGWPCRPVNVTR